MTKKDFYESFDELVQNERIIEPTSITIHNYDGDKEGRTEIYPEPVRIVEFFDYEGRLDDCAVVDPQGVTHLYSGD